MCAEAAPGDEAVPFGLPKDDEEKVEAMMAQDARTMTAALGADVATGCAREEKEDADTVEPDVPLEEANAV